MAERLGLDSRAVRRVQRLRDKYGGGPLMLRMPGRSQAVILDPEHVHRVLDNTPEPFATAEGVKRRALSHFEPKGVLISHGKERSDRRRFNEEVLDSLQPVHRLGERFVSVVDEEARSLLQKVAPKGELDWETFADTWFRVVRRVVFGDGARDDQELRTLINKLRYDANWAIKPKRKHIREQFFNRLRSHLARAEPGSLAEVIASARKTEKTAPAHQVPQWLFAFDPSGMTTFRALALLATHPEHAARAREEVSSRNGTPRTNMPYLRACVLESLRLWPTTPLVLRQSTIETIWETGVMPADTSILIFAPLFHRAEHLPYADSLAPELWLEDRPADAWPLIPFSEGPGICPGRHLVLMLTSAMLAALLDGREIRLKQPERLEPGNLPGSLNNYSLRFEITA
jgi:cytochrome P450